MADLRREVASRLRNALHGREIDIMKNRVEVPHMLGVTPIGKIHDPQNEEMTLLDTKHQFWQDYDGDTETKSAIMEEIETAIRSLRKDDTFRMTYPYGEEAEVTYVEVDELRSKEKQTTKCAECGENIPYSLELENLGDTAYAARFHLDCPSCDFSGTFESPPFTRA